MTKNTLLLLLLVITSQAFAQGIIWETDIEIAFKKAKVTNKPVFIECYLTTCPICMSFEPVLKTNAAVGAFYNKNFINFKLNGEKAEQVKFLNDKNIYLPSFPMFLYFDANKNLIHQSDAGEPKEENIVNLGKVALDPAKRASSYKKRYEEGERDFNLLFAYAYYARVIKDTTTNLNIANSLYETYPKEELNSATSWALTKKIVMDIDNGFAQHWFEHVDIARQYETQAGHANGEQNALGGIIQASMFSPRGMNYSSAKINTIKEYMTKIGADQYKDSFTWQHEAKALVREGQPDKAAAIVESLATKVVDNGPSLVYLASFINDNLTDTKYTTLSQKWLNQAKPLLKENNHWAEYYYQYARLNQKTGNKAEASQNLTEAKKYATLAKTDLKKYNELAEQLK